MFVIPKKKDRKLCAAYRCQNLKPDHDRFCPKHRKRMEKEVNPLRYTYNALRSNAKRRGKKFSLTLEEYKSFCSDTGYLELRGKTARSASIDRIDHGKGYEAGNLQILSLGENSKKRWEDDLPF